MVLATDMKFLGKGTPEKHEQASAWSEVFIKQQNKPPRCEKKHKGFLVAPWLGPGREARRVVPLQLPIFEGKRVSSSS